MNAQSTAEFCANTDEMFGMPAVTESDITTTETVNQHAIIMNNFVNAIHHDEPLIAPAQDGLASLDIANAMLLSTWQKQAIALPMDRNTYQNELNKKANASTLRTKSNAEAKVDMSASYR